MSNILNIGHRGWCSKYPENTMMSFMEAYKLGIDGVETDIQLTKDNVPVIMHDEEVDRTTNGKGMVKDFTLKEIRELDAGIKYGKEFAGLKVPTFDEFLDFYKDKNQIINLELKNSIIHYKDLEEIVLKKVYEYHLESKVIISSFNHYSIKKIMEIDRGIQVGILYWDCIYHPEQYGKSLGVDALHPEFNSLDDKIVSDSHSLGLKINAYTVDKEEDLKRMIDLKIDGIITDCPDKLKKIISNL